MKYVDWMLLSDYDFIYFLQNMRKKVSIYNDPYVDDYMLIFERIKELLSKKGSYIDGYKIKSLGNSYRYFSSLSSLYKLERLVDNKNNLSQDEINEIINNIVKYEENYISVCSSIGKKITMISNHLGANIVSKDKYNEASNYLDNLLNEYKNSKCKSDYIKSLYSNDLIDIEKVDEYFSILMDYYTKSITDTSFMKVYKNYPMSKILEIDKVILSYKTLIKNISNFLHDNKCNIKNIDFDVTCFINDYNSFKFKDDFFSYLYIHNNITPSILKEYLKYYKKLYLDNYNTKYNSDLNTLYKLDNIYDEYALFIDSLYKPELIDKDIIDEYICSNYDLDRTFINLYKNDKLKRGLINNLYTGTLSNEELLKYSIIVSFINNRLLIFKYNNIFRDNVVLTNIKNKKLYYDLMNEYYYKRGFKPTSKYVHFRIRELSKEERLLTKEYEDIYIKYYNDKRKSTIKEESIRPKEALEVESVDINKLVEMVDYLMNNKSQYLLLDFYKLSPYNITTFYNMVKFHLNVPQKVFLNQFYGTYKNDITISDLRIKDILEKEVYRYGIDENTMYTMTKEDKEQVLLLLKEENIPITNNTFFLRLGRYFESIRPTLTSNKKLIKK